MLPYVIGDEANEALLLIDEYYRENFPSAGQRILRSIVKSIDLIRTFPEGVEVIERYEDKGFRKKLVGERLIIYRIVEIDGVLTILIDSIVNGTWDYDKILDLL